GRAMVAGDRNLAVSKMRIRLRRHPHVEDAVHAEHAVALAAKLRRAPRSGATPDIDALVIARLTLHPGHAQRHARLRISAAKAAAVAPGSVEMAVIGPRQRPVVAARGQAPVRVKVELDGGDDRAFWIRRLQR